jgi:hypothetical protein
MGFDFNYEYAEEWFINLDKMIHYVNLGTNTHGVNMFYSTPQFYARTKLAYPISWPSKSPQDSDGFPYADGPHSYWTGYLSSRAALKGYIRSSSNIFQALKQIQAVTGPFNITELDPANPILELRRAMAVVQHHDAVAGTSMQHVANDYSKRIARGLKGAESIWSGAFGNSGIVGVSCDLTNASICDVFETLTTVPVRLALYNTKSQSFINAPVRIPVSFGPNVVSYTVTTETNTGTQPVVAQIVPLSSADTMLRSYYSHQSNPAVTSAGWLVFLANINATTFSYYTITASSSFKSTPFTSSSRMYSSLDKSIPRSEEGSIILTNGDVTLTFDNVTQLISSFASATLGISTTSLVQSFFFYNSSTGNEIDGQSGGAYILRPNSSNPFLIDFSTAPALEIITGSILNEARVSLPWFSIITRLWQGQQTFDSDYAVGPVPISDGMGKEIVSRLHAPTLATYGAWKSDSNCRDMILRVRNFRPSWNASIEEPIAANFAPITCSIETTDTTQGLTLFVTNDRAQAGGSIIDGSIELLIHRRLLADDQRGVGEPLNETGITGMGLIVRGLHRIGLAPTAGGVAASLRRAAMLDVSLFPPLFRYCAQVDCPSVVPLSPQVLEQQLPDNLHLLTFQHVSIGTVLVRLAHLFEVNEHPVLSQNVTVNLGALFTIPLINCTEMTLPGAQALDTSQRSTFHFTSSKGVENSVTAPASVLEMDELVTLSPMQVRTWICSR